MCLIWGLFGGFLLCKSEQLVLLILSFFLFMLILAFSYETSLPCEVSGALEGILQKKHKGKNSMIICLHMQKEISMAILKKFFISDCFFHLVFPLSFSSYFPQLSSAVLNKCKNIVFFLYSRKKQCMS